MKCADFSATVEKVQTQWGEVRMKIRQHERDGYQTMPRSMKIADGSRRSIVVPPEAGDGRKQYGRTRTAIVSKNPAQ